MAGLKYAVVNAATGNTVVVAAVANTVIRLVNYVVVGDPASSVQWRSGTTTVKSGAMSLAANGGISSHGSRLDPLLETDLGEALTVEVAGASSDAQGHIAYLQILVG